MPSTRTDRYASLAALTLAAAAMATASDPAHALLTVICEGPCSGGTSGPPPSPPPPGAPVPPPPAPVPIPVFSIDGPDSIVEGDLGSTPVAFTVSLGAPFTGVVSFDLESVDVSATGPADYVAFSFGLTITDAASLPLSVPILGDLLAEGDETFRIVVRNVTANGVTYGGTVEKLFTILDNDGPPVASTVPEPGSAALAGGALLALAWAGQRARRRVVR